MEEYGTEGRKQQLNAREGETEGREHREPLQEQQGTSDGASGTAGTAGEVPFRLFASSREKKEPSVDMSQVVGTEDILFVCLDTLRYDVAVEEQQKGTTPVLNRYGQWEKRQAPGNFTWPSHHAMFAGFLPAPYEARNLADREMLFFPRQIGMGNKIPPGAFGFSGSTIMEGLEREGYDTWCVGGVAFFDKRSDLGKVFPGYFKKSYWNPSFGCAVKDSTKNQVDFLLKKLEQADTEQRIFLYLNVDAIHYPNYFYLEEAGRSGAEDRGSAVDRGGAGSQGNAVDCSDAGNQGNTAGCGGAGSRGSVVDRSGAGNQGSVVDRSGAGSQDSGADRSRTGGRDSTGSHRSAPGHDGIASHGAALRYVDGELGRLFDRWKEKRGGAFVICCSDHGTCYGEDGCQFHGINHPVVNTIPYKHFFL